MKYAVFDENGLPIAFYDPDVHSNIPENAIPITEEQWLEFMQNQGSRKWDFETKQVMEFNPDDFLSLDALKRMKLPQLRAATKAYIELHYSGVKQRSDIADKEYWGAWLLAHNQNYTTEEIYRSVFQSVSRILSGQSILEDELQNYPEEERVAWDQLIKIGLRVGFVQSVKQEYYQFVEAIENAETKEELRAIKFQFKTQWPL